MPTPSRAETDEAAVLAVNGEFYQAIEALDLGHMEALWWHEDWVRCLHPGWELISGWVAVVDSWASLFRSSVQLHVVASRPFVRVLGDVAWVSCLEQVTTTYETDFATVMVEATNIFVRRQGQWRLAHRHASLLPGRMAPGPSQSVQ